MRELRCVVCRRELTDRLIGILDAQLGVMCRKFARYIDALIYEVLVAHGIPGRNVPEMLTACAIGMVEICGTDEKLFCERLTALVDTLMQGLQSKMELTQETGLPGPPSV